VAEVAAILIVYFGMPVKHPQEDIVNEGIYFVIYELILKMVTFSVLGIF
jgi:hypothetical protein